MVVMVIIAMMAAVTVPRLTGTREKQFRQTIDEIADLMTMYAQRDALSPKPIGIFHDLEDRVLSLVTLELIDPLNSTSAEWRVDAHVTPVAIPDFIKPDNIMAYEDGQPVGITQIPMMNTPGKTRTAITVVVAYDDYNVELYLPPHAVSPIVTGLYDNEDFVNPRESEDLDDLGRSREDW